MHTLSTQPVAASRSSFTLNVESRALIVKCIACATPVPTCQRDTEEEVDHEQRNRELHP
jgi:hypothetical protein